MFTAILLLVATLSLPVGVVLIIVGTEQVEKLHHMSQVVPGLENKVVRQVEGKGRLPGPPGP